MSREPPRVRPCRPDELGPTDPFGASGRSGTEVGLR